MMTKDEIEFEAKINRYLAIELWARKRYAENGQIVLYRGKTPSRYTRIEHAAARRYLGVTIVAGTMGSASLLAGI